jgi:uncharacterized protein (DUF1501 family)
MKRRSFAQAAALLGLTISIPVSTRRVQAQTDAYGGPYYVLINAGGGWDPRFHFDPILDEAQNRIYKEVGKIGNISFAPIPLPPPDPDAAYDVNTVLLTNEQFLTKHGKRLLVINGVDMQTNNHDAGSRAIWSGKLQEGYPSIGALIAAERAGNQPMAYLSSGGFDATEGLVPLTRVGSASTLRNIAFPNRMDPGNPESLDTYHSEATWSRIQQLQNERLKAKSDAATLPRIRTSLADLRLARENDDDLQKLEIPADLITLEGYDLRVVESAMQQAQIAISAFKSGIAAAVNLNLGGFDTHGNHDSDQPEMLSYLFAVIDFTISEVEKAGLTDKVVILVGSDFARGPLYNGPEVYDGKDHWPIGSFVAMGPGIEGTRVIGATTPGQMPMGVDPSSLATLDSGGTIITAQHIHHSLRKLAGLTTLAENYPLPGEPLPLFG